MRRSANTRVLIGGLCRPAPSLFDVLAFVLSRMIFAKMKICRNAKIRTIWPFSHKTLINQHIFNVAQYLLCDAFYTLIYKARLTRKINKEALKQIAEFREAKGGIITTQELTYKSIKYAEFKRRKKRFLEISIYFSSF